MINIELTFASEKEEKFNININNICRLQDNPDNPKSCMVYFENMAFPYVVKETRAEINKLILEKQIEMWRLQQQVLCEDPRKDEEIARWDRKLENHFK